LRFYVNEHLGQMAVEERQVDLQPLRKTTLAPDTHPTRLVRALPARGPIDQSWNLQVNTSVEPDL